MTMMRCILSWIGKLRNSAERMKILDKLKAEISEISHIFRLSFFIFGLSFFIFSLSFYIQLVLFIFSLSFSIISLFFIYKNEKVRNKMDDLEKN